MSYEPMLPQDFHNNGRQYRYSYELVTAQMCILVEEVALFKQQQREKPPERFMQLQTSGALEAFSRMGAYLLRRIENGEPQKFSPMLAESETMPFVDDLPAAEHRRLEACIDDFFLRHRSVRGASTIFRGSSSISTGSLVDIVSFTQLLRSAANSVSDMPKLLAELKSRGLSIEMPNFSGASGVPSAKTDSSPA